MTTRSAVWEWDDDPALPCAYCVAWVDDPSDETGQTQVPHVPDGAIARRVYRGVHPACAEAVAAYQSERNASEGDA